jgi:hypothetical protein
MPMKSSAGKAGFWPAPFFRSSVVLGEDHLAHGVDAVAFEEHVLGAAEADAGRAEGDGVGGLLGIVGVGADLEAGGLASTSHELLEVLIGLGSSARLVAFEQALDDLEGAVLTWPP